MIFQTGAALLDAIVLAVVSKEEEGTYRKYAVRSRFRNRHSIRYSGGCKRTGV